MNRDYRQIHHAKLNGITYTGREALLQLIQQAKCKKTGGYLFMYCGIAADWDKGSEKEKPDASI